MEIRIIKTLNPEESNKREGGKKEQRTGGSIESSSPNITIIILYIHKVELHFQGKDCQIG